MRAAVVGVGLIGGSIGLALRADEFAEYMGLVERAAGVAGKAFTTA